MLSYKFEEQLINKILFRWLIVMIDRLAQHRINFLTRIEIYVPTEIYL